MFPRGKTYQICVVFYKDSKDSFEKLFVAILLRFQWYKEKS